MIVVSKKLLIKDIPFIRGQILRLPFQTKRVLQHEFKDLGVKHDLPANISYMNCCLTRMMQTCGFIYTLLVGSEKYV